MNSFYFWDEMAAKCLKSEHFQEAIQSYKHALESTDQYADQASVWANIGNIYLTIQDIPSAVDAFMTASRLDPSSYDFDCILERVTATGYLDESAMVMAKDMYALEGVKTSPEGEVGIDQPPADVLAEDEAAFAVDTEITAPIADANVTETVLGQTDAEPLAGISQQLIVESVSSEETGQPQAAPDEIGIPVEIEVTEPIGLAEFPGTAADIEPAEPVFSEEISQPVVESSHCEVTTEVEVAETAPVFEIPDWIADIVVPEPIAEETNPGSQVVFEAPEPTATAETDPVAADMAGMDAAFKPESTQAYVVIPVAEILENPLHLRSSMQSEELVESIRRYGILQPLVVTRMEDGKYMVVTGNRRLEAARLAGLEYVPAVLRSATECEFLELALIDNIQRVNLDPLELAEAYHILVERFGMSVDLIAASIGKNSSAVTAALNLLKLTEEGKQALLERAISEGHARVLVEIDLPALQNNALVYVLENRLGVRQTEDLVRIIMNAVAVSRSYDESYLEETSTETPQQESIPLENTAETALETPEIGPVAETELPSAETDAALDAVVEPEVTQTVDDAPDTNPELEIIETASAVEPEITPDLVAVADQPVLVEVTDDAIMDLLVAESEKAEALLENNAGEDKVEQVARETVLEEESIDFYWIKPEAETSDQVQQDGIHSTAPAELLTEDYLEKDAIPAAIPAETIYSVVNGNAMRDTAIETEVIVTDSEPSPVLETALRTAEENLEDVIEEIVQFTAVSNSPVGEASAEENMDQTPANPKPVAELEGSETLGQKEPEEIEIRTQLKGLEAIAVYKRVVENNPANVRIWHLLGNLYSDIGQYDEAIDCLKRTVELDPSKYNYFYHLGLTLAIARRYLEAIQALEKTVELAPQHILAHCSLAGCYRRTGNETEAQKHIEIARPKLMQEKAYNRACFESISGNNDQAIELLHIALDTDRTPLEWLVRDPDLDFIRDDPRFQALIAELKLPA